MSQVIVAPSMLSADFARLDETVDGGENTMTAGRAAAARASALVAGSSIFGAVANDAAITAIRRSVATAAEEEA